jgi:hypothetical protein
MYLHLHEQLTGLLLATNVKDPRSAQLCTEKTNVVGQRNAQLFAGALVY